MTPARARLESGIELHYAECGRGAPLVLLHGGSGDLYSWQPQLAEFARRYRVIAYSRRYSYPNRNRNVLPNYSAHVDAEDLASLLSHLGLSHVRLVGTSYGALAALAFAVRQPRQVRSLVCAEPPAHRWVEPAVYRRFMEEVWQPAAQAFRRCLSREAMRLLADGMWGQPIFDRLPPATVAAMMRNARAMKALALSSNPFPRLASKKLERLPAGVLLIAGEHAAPIHRLANHALARLLPDARQDIIPGAGHGSPRENAPAFNRAVLEFLEGR